MPTMVAEAPKVVLAERIQSAISEADLSVLIKQRDPGLWGEYVEQICRETGASDAEVREVLTERIRSRQTPVGTALAAART